jgi:hypothetical protein
VWDSAKEDLRLQRPLPGRREVRGDGGTSKQGLAILYDVTSRDTFAQLAPFVTELRRRYDAPFVTERRQRYDAPMPPFVLGAPALTPPVGSSS